MKIEYYNKEIRENFKKIAGHDATVYFSDFDYKLFEEELIDAKKRRAKSKLHISEINFLDSNVPYFSWPPTKYFESKGKLYSQSNRTGMFHIKIIEGKKVYHAVHVCYLTGFKHDVVNLTCCDNITYKKITQIKNKQTHKLGKPSLGVFTFTQPSPGLYKYVNYKKELSTKTIYHKIKKKVLEDVSYFYKNLERSISHGEKGTRKILLAGPQGTGKSSFLQELMIVYKDTHSILISKDLNELATHITNCAKYSIPCMPILEDCESFLGLQQEHSSSLNLLSGPLEPKNSGGTYIVFTTNHPDQLSDRIKHRPERIDEIFILGALDEEDALEVTKLYFSYLPKEFDFSTLKGLFKDYTGAEIMKFALDVKKNADYETGSFDKIDKKYIEKVIKRQMNKYRALEEVDTGKTMIAKKEGSTRYGSIGFNSGYGSSLDE